MGGRLSNSHTQSAGISRMRMWICHPLQRAFAHYVVGWISRRWPDPLSIKLEGVVLEFDMDWAIDAFVSAAMYLYETERNQQ